MAEPEIPSDDSTLDLCGRTLGDFILREQVGQGGSAVVYRGEQPTLRRDVVIKVLRARGNRNNAARERFLREAQLASQLDHPYAAHVYAFGAEPNGLLWLAMEIVHGVTLARWLETRGAMPLETFVPFFESVAEVVQTAHERGIVHRDLKPSNVMVIERGGRLFPKLLDFGIARVTSSVTRDAITEPGAEAPRRGRAGDTVTARIRVTDGQGYRTRTHSNRYRLTRTGAGMGSAPYMSPEQWRDARDAEPASDIYSLGILAYESLTGRRPFIAESTNEFYRQHAHAEMPNLGELSPQIDAVLRRALAKDPAARHRDVMELASDLRAVLRAHPREQLRSSVQQWVDRSRTPRLLWGRDALADLARCTGQLPAEGLSELECSFVAASQRRARRNAWLRRAILVLAAACVVGGLQLRSIMKARVAEQIAMAAEKEQARQALLHGESSEAARILYRLHQRGVHTPDLDFMLARALQPRMAEQTRFAASSGRMWSAIFAPDDKRVLTTDDTDAQMWDAQSGQLLFSMHHGDTVYQAVFTPDGSQIVTAGGDGTVRIWNAATGALIHELTARESRPNPWRFYAVAVTPQFVAAIDTLGRATMVWELATGTQVAELESGGAGFYVLAFSSDGRWLASSGGDDVRVFDTASWQRVATIPGPRVRSLAFAPVGQTLVVGTFDGIASTWDAPAGARLHALRAGGDSVDAVAFSRDGALVATGSRDGTEQVWDVASGGLKVQLNAHHSKIFAIEFARSRELMLSAGADGAVVVSSFATGMSVARLEGPSGSVLAAHFDRDARRVVGASWDGTARVWNAASPYQLWATSPIGPECNSEESLVPDQRIVAISCKGRGTRVLDTATGEVVAQLPEVTSTGADYYSALPALTATGDQVAIARDDTVEVYALPSGQLLRTIKHSGLVNAVAFAPTGHDLVSGAIDGSLQITRSDGDIVALPRSPAGIDAVALLADGRVLAADASSKLRVIDTSAQSAPIELAAGARVRLLRPAPDGIHLVTIFTPTKLVPPAVWDLHRLQRVAQLDSHNVNRAFSARFTAGSERILTGGSDGTARLWNGLTGELLRTFQGDSHFLADAAISPDGGLIVAGGSDGLLRFWDSSNGRLLWTLLAHKSYVVGVHYEGNDLVTRGFAGDVARWSLPRPDKVINDCRANACGPVGQAED